MRSNSKSALIAIHDVHADNFAIVDRFLNKLPDEQAFKTALMVVPRWRNSQPMRQQTEFISWLNGRIQKGQEIFIHGLRHYTEESLSLKNYDVQKTSRSFWGRFVNQCLTHQQAELCGLNEKRNLEIVLEARKEFEQSKIPYLGFAAPTWHANIPINFLKKQSFHFLDGRYGFVATQSGQNVLAFPLVPQSCSSPIHTIINKIQMATIPRISRIIRLVLHPNVLESQKILSPFLNTLTSRKIIRYSDSVQF